MPELTEFAGLPVIEFPAEGTQEERLERIREQGGDPNDPSFVAWRLWFDSNTPDEQPDYAGYMARFLADVDTERVRALTIGSWGLAMHGGPEKAVELLVEHADALPNLRSLFVGDIGPEECEISWINQGDMAPLLTAFPRLEELATRGTYGTMGGLLHLHVPSHTSLRSLAVQSGGLPSSVVREVVSSGLPELEHLELWLGTEDYGRDTEPRDLEPVLSGEAFPKLRYLGVRNSENLEEWIPVLAQAPVTKSLEVLDLSLGALTDKGAQALLDRIEAFSGLRELDLHHHYLSEEMVERVRTAFAGAGVEVDLSDPQEPEDYGDGPEYYTAESE